MYRGSVFIQSRNLVENGGLIVAKARHVELAGGAGVVSSSLFVHTTHKHACTHTHTHTHTHIHTHTGTHTHARTHACTHNTHTHTHTHTGLYMFKNHIDTNTCNLLGSYSYRVCTSVT